MIVGRLFIALGVKGAKQAQDAIGGVKGGLKETASAGLAAKAAIVGAVYALERLFSKSGQVGTDLTNFSAALGISAKTLQQYQYAARQVGVSNEAVDSSFRGLQSTITKTLMGKGAPEGLARVAQVVAALGKDMSPVDLVEFADDPSKLIQRLQEYAQLEQNQGLKVEVLRSFGLGDDMIAALSRNAFQPEIMAKAPTYNEGEIKALDRANVAWSNLGDKIQKAVGHLNAEHGLKLVNDISAVADQVIRLTQAFVDLADKLKLFEAFGMVFEGWTHIFKGLGDILSPEKKTEGLKKIEGESGEKPKPFIDFPSVISDFFASAFGAYSAYASSYQGQEAAANPTSPGVGVTSGPQAAAPSAVPNTTTQNNNQISVQQNLNFSHPGENAKQTGDSVKRATQNAFRQMPGLAQGS